MEEYQGGALPHLAVGNGLPIDLYITHLNTSHRFQPCMTQAESTVNYHQPIDWIE